MVVVVVVEGEEKKIDARELISFSTSPATILQTAGCVLFRSLARRRRRPEPRGYVRRLRSVEWV